MGGPLPRHEGAVGDEDGSAGPDQGSGGRASTLQQEVIERHCTGAEGKPMPPHSAGSRSHGRRVCMHRVAVSSPHSRCDQQDQRVLLITARSSALPPASGPVMQARQHSLALNKSVSLVGSHAGRGEARRLHARPAAQHHSGTQAARGTHSHQRPSYTRHEGRTQSHHALGLHVPMDANTKHKTGMGG